MNLTKKNLALVLIGIYIFFGILFKAQVPRFLFPWAEFVFVYFVSSVFQFTINFKILKLLLPLPLLKNGSIYFISGFILSIIVFKIFPEELNVSFLNLNFFSFIFAYPILEELIFRHIILNLQKLTSKNNLKIIIFNSFLFSLSHGSYIFNFDELLKSFIIIQCIYTFIFSLFIAKTYYKSSNIFEVVIYHWAFNGGFYLNVVFN